MPTTAVKCVYHIMLLSLSHYPDHCSSLLSPGEKEGGVLPYIALIGMCHREGYGFQALWSGIGYRNQGVLV